MTTAENQQKRLTRQICKDFEIMSEEHQLKTEKEAIAQKIAESWEELENQLFELWRFVAKRHASPDRIKEVQARLEKCTDLGIYLEDPEIKEEG